MPERTDFTSTFTSGSTEPTSVTRTWTSPTSAFAVLTPPASSAGLPFGRNAASPPAIATPSTAIQIQRRTRFPFDFAMEKPLAAEPGSPFESDSYACYYARLAGAVPESGPAPGRRAAPFTPLNQRPAGVC
ncbi:MAG: hypothetical protein U0599_24630 [Vicinamibacteria bacterium]